MSVLLAIQDLRLGSSGSALTASLSAGQVMGVFGPSGGGKTRFLHAIFLGERHRKGSVRMGGDAILASPSDFSRRSTPESIARRAAGRSGASRVAEALAATRLWEDRKSTFASLAPGAQAACELLPVLASHALILGIDGQLDRLDPWTRGTVLELIGKRLGQGCAFVFATSLTELAPRTDLLTVWRAGSPVYAGTYRDLERRHGWTQIEVETLHAPSARALCDPFEVSVKAVDGGLSLKAKKGQALAASLLLDGYGDVKAVIERPPTPEEVLSGI